MNIDSLKALEKAGKVKPINEPLLPAVPKQIPFPSGMEMYLAPLQAIRLVRQHLTIPPTLEPKSFTDQIQFYDDGSEQRVYFFINNVWRYVTLS